jgi:hypothetical protein
MGHRTASQTLSYATARGAVEDSAVLQLDGPAAVTARAGQRQVR